MIKILNIQGKTGYELMHGNYDVLAELQDNCTNGDMIKALFPNAQIDYHEKSELVDKYVTVFPKDCDTCQDYSWDWWNAPYERSE